MAKAYIIVAACDCETLARDVNDRMEQGYMPHGSMVYDGQARSSYMQPMVLLGSQKVIPLNTPRGR